MKLHAIVCEALSRETYRAAANSPHIVKVTVMAFGLHNTPDDLRAALQAEIDASSGPFDAVVMGYGLCSRGTADLSARDIPVVIPRAHDCITLFLGSRHRYDEEFEGHPGTYYYSAGWVERKEGEVHQGDIRIVQNDKAEERFREYVEKYGEDNAVFLMEQEQLWQQHYNRAALIDTGLGDIEYYRRFTRQVAETNGWAYEEIPGDTRLIDKLLAGDWNDSEFLTVLPGQRTSESVNAGVISAG